MQKPETGETDMVKRAIRNGQDNGFGGTLQPPQADAPKPELQPGVSSRHPAACNARVSLAPRPNGAESISRG